MSMISVQKEWHGLDFRKPFSCVHHHAWTFTRIVVFTRHNSVMKQEFMSLVYGWGKLEMLCNLPEATQLGDECERALPIFRAIKM